MRAVVVSHGEVDPGDVAHVRGADLVIAADGGLLHLRRWGIEPAVIVGDLDSLSENPSAVADLKVSSAVDVEVHPRDKDKSDTELALDRALASGADDVVLVGVLGGPRIDHAIANTLLLQRSGVHARVRIVRGPMVMRLIRGGERVELHGSSGELVTLVALGDAPAVVRTSGLRFPLNDEPLAVGSSRGLSNEIARAPAEVSCGSGALLVIEGGSLLPRR